jgi:hypothetical protein
MTGWGRLLSHNRPPPPPAGRRPHYAEFPVCNGNFGNTEGCTCKGRAIDNSEYVIKTSAKLGVSEQSLKRTACLAGNWNTTPTVGFNTSKTHAGAGSRINCLRKLYRLKKKRDEMGDTRVTLIRRRTISSPS